MNSFTVYELSIVMSSILKGPSSLPAFQQISKIQNSKNAHFDIFSHEKKN